MNNQEVWRPIDGFEGLYEVSNLGRVRSLDRYVNRNGGIGLLKGRILKPQLVIGGYIQVTLYRNCKPSLFKIHRLVAMTFQDICGQYIKELEVDHKNTVRTDNRAENLHWVTRKENCNNPLTRQHKYNAKKGEKHPLYGKNGKDNSTLIQIVQYDLQDNLLAEFDSLSEAERKTGIHHQNVGACCRGKRKTAGGFKWKFKDINS